MTVERGRLLEAETPKPEDDPVAGRILEAKGTAPDGGRIFATRIIAVGTSKNGVRYTEAVLRRAAGAYEGAKAYDHHRTVEELRTSSVRGLVGHHRGVSFQTDGLYGDLHLLPSAGSTAEALDQSIANVAMGLPPLVGISHDVQADYIPATDGTRHIREATAIHKVASADVVADPSAGGRAVRMVAGGLVLEPEGGDPANDKADPEPDKKPEATAEDPTTPKAEEADMTLRELLSKLQAANPLEQAALLAENKALLERNGFSLSDTDSLTVLLGPGQGLSPDTPVEPAAADIPPATPPTDIPAPANAPQLVGAGNVTESTEPEYARGSAIGDYVVEHALKSKGLPESLAGKVAGRLPLRFTESAAMAEVERTAEILEAVRPADVPAFQGGGGQAVITEDQRDKAVKRLEATFNGDLVNGFHRLSEAYFAVTGKDQRRWFTDTDMVAHEIIRESWGGPMVGGRLTEAITSTTWGEVVADVMNKRMMQTYSRPDLLLWRQLVSSATVLDFRSQKLIRIGGYGTLPVVNEGQPYQELTSPTDEQVTYTPSKRGGIESYTWESAINDDMRALTRIPDELALAAAVTLNAAIWTIFTSNPNLADGFALFDNTNHGNTASGTALSETGLNTLRQKMRDQVRYGDQTSKPMGLTPDFLLVPNELEDQANKVTTGPALLPGGTSYASDQPNLHTGLKYIVVDDWTDANDYIVMAGPAKAPTIEVGFLQGRENPELFVQDDATAGSMFSADKVTWKIRHVWGYGVLDHRPFQRMTN